MVALTMATILWGGALAEPVERWGVFVATLSGPEKGNPFRDVELTGEFAHEGGTKITAEGFYDGEGVYKIRFMPTLEGAWSYRVKSNDPALDGATGQFECVAPSANNHGPVGVHNQFHFAYADGKPFLPVGTTLYEWVNQPEDVQEQTLKTLAKGPFNKARMLVAPVFDDDLRPGAGDFFPFERGADGAWDFTRPNVAFFRHYEERIADLCELGIEADVILYCPYELGKKAFGAMGAENDEYYQRYIIARFVAYRNVWWSLANEFDDMLDVKPMEEWDRMLETVAKYDPYGHLRSIHNHHDPYDYSNPLVTHVSYQMPVTARSIEIAESLRERYGKPVIIDEMLYEGDQPANWGSITAGEMVNRFWQCAASGVYATHGETFQKWKWTSGGKYYGKSPKRLAFLREILEDAPREGLTPIRPIHTWRMRTAGVEGEYYLIYLEYHQPASIKLTLPEGNLYSVEAIDTWKMEIKKIKGEYKAGDEVKLPVRPWQALRIRKIGETE